MMLLITEDGFVIQRYSTFSPVPLMTEICHRFLTGSWNLESKVQLPFTTSLNFDLTNQSQFILIEVLLTIQGLLCAGNYIFLDLFLSGKNFKGSLTFL
jgi:hypothetical protein